MKKMLGFILFALTTQFVYAADEAVKEDTTPPPAEGPITTDQIPLLSSIETKKMPIAPPSPVPAGSQQQPITAPEIPKQPSPQQNSPGSYINPQQSNQAPIQQMTPPKNPAQMPMQPIQPQVSPPPTLAPQGPVGPQTAAPYPSGTLSSGQPSAYSSSTVPQQPMSYGSQPQTSFGAHISDKVPDSEILN